MKYILSFTGHSRVINTLHSHYFLKVYKNIAIVKKDLENKIGYMELSYEIVMLLNQAEGVL